MIRRRVYITRRLVQEQDATARAVRRAGAEDGARESKELTLTLGEGLERQGRVETTACLEGFP